MDRLYEAAVGQQNYSAVIKLLDVAVEMFDTASQSQQEYHQLLLNRGYCNQRLQLYRKALKDLDAVLKDDPTHLRAMLRKGQVLHALKKTDEAQAVWSAALAACNFFTDLELRVELQTLLAGQPQANGMAPTEQPPAAPAAAPAPAQATAPAAPLAPKPEAPSPPAAGAAPKLPPRSTSPAQPSLPNGTAGTSTSSAASSSTAAAAPAPKQPKKAASKPAAVATPAATANSQSKQTSPTSDVEEIDCVAQAATAAKRAAAARHMSAMDIARAQLSQQLVNQAVININSGKVDDALEALDGVLRDSPKDLSALVARGTARALKRELQGAVDDFTAAIKIEPRYPDSWKRRGQARSALGEHEEALADLQRCLELLPTFAGVENVRQSMAECHVERALMYQKVRDWRRAAGELRKATEMDDRNVQAWNMLGLCLTSLGDIGDGVAAYRRAAELSPNQKDCWVNMALALKEASRVKEAEEAFLKVWALDKQGGPPSIHAMRIMAQMRQGQGRHAQGVHMASKAIAAATNEQQKVDLMFIRAICNHALGYHKEAVEDYERVFNFKPAAGASSEEQAGQQLSAWYQKELALYVHHNMDRNVRDFCPDCELSAVLKENWCKKGAPSSALLATYKVQPPIKDSNKQAPPPADPSKLKELTAVADQLGELLQNRHQGFLPNVRQQRAAGYAAIELAQAVVRLVGERRRGRDVWVNSEGASGQRGSSGRHQFGWRDAMDIVVKWRQLAEPNDQVLWVDLLTRAEFESGFGSHTPMFSGQTKCVRYYMVFERALALLKELLLREGHAFDAQNRKVPLGADSTREEIKKAKTAQDMWLTIGVDSWVVVPIASAHRDNHKLEGTRLTMVKVPNQPDAYEFSIRTPVTPPRWEDFDKELDLCWEDVICHMAKGDMLATADAILTYAYYWYNFMPLARGTAAVGYTTILALFWAAGMPVSERIPPDYQVDWEAILAQRPEQFRSAVGRWLYPAEARVEAQCGGGGGVGGCGGRLQPVVELPAVCEVLDTMRRRLEALNGPDAKRV